MDVRALDGRPLPLPRHPMKLQVTLERQHNGSLRASAVYNGRLISRVFYGYTMREARAVFIEELKAGEIPLVSLGY